jgi:threonine dehydrogenase-like Zn-dependent dehydrogenase
MRAAVLDDDGLGVKDWEPPELIHEDDVLIAPTKVGICGSDVHFVIDKSVSTRFMPIVLGHEPAGRVVEVADPQNAHLVGIRVAVNALVTCESCENCLRGRRSICSQVECIGCDRHGAWADLISMPARNVIPIPDGVSDEAAAVATDAISTAFHAVSTRGQVTPGVRVIIWGAGGLGLAAISIARVLGASDITAVDPRESSRRLAIKRGADRALVPEDALSSCRGVADVAFEFVGKEETVEAAVRSLDSGGRAVIVGLGVGHVSGSAISSFVGREREVVGSLGPEPEELVEVLEMMADGRLVLPDLVSESVPLEGVMDALRRVAAGKTGGSRVVVDLAA